jgi:outer membrane protein OmpA-like peptidoglycan-associated protein
MRRIARRQILIAAAWAMAAAESGAAEDDVQGSADPPLFSRMPGFYIGEYKSADFDVYQFGNAPGAPKVEGRMTSIRYWQKSGGSPVSAATICRNHTNAIKQIGGTVLQDNGRNMATMKVTKDGAEQWAEIACDNGRYALVIVEKRGLEQLVTASDMQAALDRQGFIALDIRFDTAKAVIKPESQPIVDQIATLLKGRPELRISVEGHTDNVGTPASNKTLSEARAAAVVAAITAQGVDRARLSAAGFGQERPVADNRTEDGRAKNRRVEIVKR